MSNWNQIEISVIAGSEESANKIADIDLTEYGFYDDLYRKANNFYCHLDEEEDESESFDSFFDDLDDSSTGPFALMQEFANALGSTGKAYFSLWDDNFEKECNKYVIYYYLGDEVRMRVFEKENETDYYYFENFLSALLDMSTEEISSIYRNMSNEAPVTVRNEMASFIACTLAHYETKERILEKYNNPRILTLLITIDRMRQKYDYYDLPLLEPVMDWEKKGIVQFTAIEKSMLEGMYPWRTP